MQTKEELAGGKKKQTVKHLTSSPMIVGAEERPYQAASIQPLKPVWVEQLITRARKWTNNP